ncbi:hypothetical protein DICPUDRAFT_154253 [Dictyostelium purpureum]|uniref:Pleckstrin domain-containing protein n=1 Tax=Dictyostelium purpureum TaxID=5786 RepID=F0ZQV2_DICPU|nr:uncharacterized protein DICPUDRAFT_154253 [Dictyostelium purpureum]EGC33682.1 hypothetical protein DICPUDRAFT_154253 [Dictyostelium purpureum]|eukprot:XP_003289801.1 hypothetical protein DICPUDRAFT_154253 [Dictyostelium purpureum]
MSSSLTPSSSSEEISSKTALSSYCTIFERQLWRLDKCKHCFKTEQEHSYHISRSNEITNNGDVTNIDNTNKITTSIKNNLNSTNTNNNINNNNNNNNFTSLNNSHNNNNNHQNNNRHSFNNNKGNSINNNKTKTVPSVEKAPLSIRRSLTPSAIKQFSRNISQQLIEIEPITPPLKPQSSNSPKQQHRALPKVPNRNYSNSFDLSSANTTPETLSPLLSNSTSGEDTEKLTPSNLSPLLNSSNSIDSNSSTKDLLPLSPTRQMRSHSDSPTDYDYNTINTSGSSNGNGINVSGSRPINISSGLVYEKKHARNLSGNSSPTSSIPIFYSDKQQQQQQASSSKSINSLSSGVSSGSPRKYSLFVKSKSKQPNNNNNNHVNTSTPNLPKRQGNNTSTTQLPLKSPSFPNVADANTNSLGFIPNHHHHYQQQLLQQQQTQHNNTPLNEEQNKIYFAVSSIINAIPGINNTAVHSMMDILYNQMLDIDYSNTLIREDKLAELTKATQTLQSWVDRQDYLRDVVTVQSCVRRFLSKRRTDWLSQVYSGSILKDRNNEFRGLIQLERRYNEKLDIAVNTYYKPLKASNLLTTMDLQSIFSSIKEIYYVHKKISLQFEELHKKWPCVEGLGDIFLRIAPELKVYGGYVKNFKNAIDTLISCQEENPKLASFLKECCDNTPGKVYDLMALISAPLNHLTSYERQLFNIANYTPSNWPDYVNIINSVTMMKEVEQLIESNLSQSQSQSTLMNIYRKINNRKALDPFVIAGRIFIHEGKLIKFETKKQDQTYYYYLCNDLILFVKKGTQPRELYKFKKLFMLSDVVVSDLQDTKIHKNIISIVNNNTKETLSFSIEDSREKKELMKQFSTLCTTNINKSTKIFGISLHDLMQREEDAASMSSPPTISITTTISASSSQLPSMGTSSPSLSSLSSSATINSSISSLSTTSTASMSMPIYKPSEINIPSFIVKTCNALLSYTESEGIFRISPNQSELESVRDSLNKCTSDEMLDSIIFRTNGHQLAALLKGFFRELSEPLLTFDLFDKVIEIGDNSNLSEIEQVNQVSTLLKSIPIVNQNTFQLILTLLIEISKSSEINKMNHSNLSIVFGPNLLKPRDQTIETSLKIPIINNVLTTLLDHYNLLYNDRIDFVRISDSKFFFNCKK